MRACARTSPATTATSILFVIAAAASSVTIAQELPAGEIQPAASAVSYVGVRTGVAYTDNVRRTGGSADSDTLANVGFSLDFQRTGPKLQLSSTGDIDWVEYLDNTYDGRLIGYLDAQALWGETSDILQWTVQETFGQLRTDPLAPETPDNLQNVNVLSTGPQLNFGLTDRTRLSFFGLYAKQTYESSAINTTDLDSTRYTGGTSLVRQLGEASNASLNAQVEKVEFDDNNIDNPDFETRAIYARYATRQGRMFLNADVGYTRIELEDRTSGGLLLNVQADRQVSSSSSVYVGGRSQYSNSAGALRLSASAGSISGVDTPLSTSDPFRNQQVRAGWRYERSRTGFSLGATWGKERYERRTELDRTNSGLEFTFNRRMRPTLTFDFLARLQREDYDNLDATSDERTAIAELTQQVGRHLGLSLRYERNERSGSGLVADYTENRIGLRATWMLAGSR